MPAQYHGANSTHRDYVKEPGVAEFRRGGWKDWVPINPLDADILDLRTGKEKPVGARPPEQLPRTLLETYEESIMRGYGTQVRQLLRYTDEGKYGRRSNWPRDNLVSNILLLLSLPPPFAPLLFFRSRHLLSGHHCPRLLLRLSCHRQGFPRFRRRPERPRRPSSSSRRA